MLRCGRRIAFVAHAHDFHLHTSPLQYLYTDTNLRKLVATETDPLEVCYPDDQWIDYEGTSYIFERQAYHTQCVDRHNQHRPFEYGAFMGYYTTGEPCASACVKGDNRSQLKGCYPEDR